MEQLEPIALTEDDFKRLNAYDDRLSDIRRSSNRDYAYYSETFAKKIVIKVLNELYNRNRIQYNFDGGLINDVTECLKSIVTDKKDSELIAFKDRTFSIIDGGTSEDKVLDSAGVFNYLNGALDQFTNPNIDEGELKQIEESTRKDIVEKVTGIIVNTLRSDRIPTSNLEGFIKDAVYSEAGKYQEAIKNHEKGKVHSAVYTATHELLEYIYNQAKPPINSELSNLFK